MAYLRVYRNHYIHFMTVFSSCEGPLLFYAVYRARYEVKGEISFNILSECSSWFQFR